MITLAARAALVLLSLAALVLLVRRRRRAEPAPDPIVVLTRAGIAPGLGVALVEADGRRLLVGWGRDGVRLLRELAPRGGAAEDAR